MRILIAEDDEVSRKVLERTLEAWDHEVQSVCDGVAAWQALLRDDAPKLAILDWMMPELDGVEVCRRLRATVSQEPTYVILLTAKQQKKDIVTGLDAGANDYVVKPFDRRELQSRVRVGERMLALQSELAGRVRELQAAMTQIHHLQGLLPICSYCKRIRDDKNYWQQVDSYMSERTGTQFTHGCCPECYEKIVAELEAAEV